MAWTNPKTYTAGAILTAAEKNTYERDNLIALQTGSKELVKVQLDGSTTNPAAPAAGDLAIAFRSDQDEPVIRRNSGGTQFLRTASFRESHAGLVMTTHPDSGSHQSKVLIQKLREVIFDDGYAWRPAESTFPLTIDMGAANGAGARDQGTEEASTWYSIYVIRRSDNGNSAGLFHKANRLITSEQTTANATQALRDNAARTRVAQSFSVASTGTLRAVLLQLAKVGTPSGGNNSFWVEIQSDSSGSPSGTVLATSQKWLAPDANTTNRPTPFTFYGSQAISLTGSTTYWVVVQGDFTINASNYINLSTNSAGGYGGGSVKTFDGAAWNAVATIDLCFGVIAEVDDAAITMPGNYDQRCLLGYVYNDGSSNFLPFQTADQWTTCLNQGVACSAKLAGVTDTTNIGSIIFENTQLPPVAMLEVDGVLFQTAAGPTPASVTFAALDSGILLNSSTFRAANVATVQDGPDDGGYSQMEVLFKYQMVQIYKNTVNNQSFTPRKWRVVS